MTTNPVVGANSKTFFIPPALVSERRLDVGHALESPDVQYVGMQR